MQKRIEKPNIHFNWDYARLFSLVARCGSLTAAAEKAGLSQSTLSRQMAAFEQQLAMTLFERVGRGIQVTSAGQQILEQLHIMENAANNIGFKAAGLAESLVGKVTLSVSELDAAFRIPAVIETLRQRAPELTIEVYVTNDLADLKEREADIAIRNTQPQQPDLIARKLASESIDLFGQAHYLENQRKTQFKSLQIIGFQSVEPIIRLLNQQGWNLSTDNFQVLTNFQWLQLEMAKQGQGLALLPTDIGLTQGLQPIRQHNRPIFELDVWLVSHRELRTNPKVRLVFDLLVEHLRYS